VAFDADHGRRARRRHARRRLAADGTWFTTTADLGAADQVLLQIDFGAPQEVHLIDLIDYAAKEDRRRRPTPDPRRPSPIRGRPGGDFNVGVGSGGFGPALP
jgi:hypothetical protein